MFLAFHFQEMEKIMGMFSSLFFPLCPILPFTPKELDKEK